MSSIKLKKKMILTEIKHLNVRISEFEEPIFDKNILPVFITPLILKEVAARKRSKYKIETLNPEKKLTFRIVPFNEIVEELAARINKIAIDLEPHYFIDPSYYNSLPYKVRAILNKKTLNNEKKAIAEASFRIASATLGEKKHILYARSAYSRYVPKRWYRYQYKKNSVNFLKKTATILKKKDVIKYRKLNFFPVLPSSTLPALLQKTTGLSLREQLVQKSEEIPGKLYTSINGAVARINKSRNESVNNQLLFSGWIPTSKGALMLLEDEGWDLDLLSNKNKASQRLRKLRPYSLRKLRRLRRLRRLRLMSINLYQYRSNNVKKNNYAALSQVTVRPRLVTNITNVTNVTKKKTVSLRQKRKKLASLTKLTGLTSNWTSSLTFPGYIANSWLIKKDGYNQVPQVADLELQLQMQARNHSNIYKINYDLTQPQPLTWTTPKLDQEGLLPVDFYKKINNKYLIKHNDNKLKFVINWLGDNLSYSSVPNYANQSKDSIQLTEKVIAAIHTNKPNKLSIIEKSYVSAQRLDKKNIIDIFLVKKSEAVQLPLLDEVELAQQKQIAKEGAASASGANLVLNKNQNLLAQIDLFKKSRVNLAEKKKVQIEKAYKLLKLRLKNKNKSKKYKRDLKGAWTAYKRGYATLSLSLLRSRTEKEAPLLIRPSNCSNIPSSTLITSNPQTIIMSNQTFAHSWLRTLAVNFPFFVSGKRARTMSETNFTSRLKAINSKVENWKKKKNLSAVLLDKTKLRYVKAQQQIRKSGLFSEDDLPVNKKQIVKILDKNLNTNYLKKIKSLAEIKQHSGWEKVASLLLKLVLQGYGKRGFMPTASRTRLFWNIIKLYSSSFNPIFNSFNNKYLTSLSLFGKETAQIKILSSPSADSTEEKNNSNNDTLSPTDLMLKLNPVRNTTNLVQPSLKGGREKEEHKKTIAQNLPIFTSLTRTKSKGANKKNYSKSESESKDGGKNSKVNITKIKLSLPALVNKTVKKDNNATLINSLDKVAKAEKYKGNSVALASSLKANRTEYRATTPSFLADNKIFVFLYFIVPIFFAIVQNSAPFKKIVKPSTLRFESPNLPNSKLVVKRMQKKLNNQIKQLRSLIKLMLNSGSAISNQWILRSRYNYAEGELHQTSENFTSDLLKSSILFIAQSLAPLKRKHEYYSLIFIKILKSRGLLALLKKKQNFFLSNLLSPDHSDLKSTKKIINKSSSPAAPSIRQTTTAPTATTAIMAPTASTSWESLLTSSAPSFYTLLASALLRSGRTAAPSNQLVLKNKNKIIKVGEEVQTSIESAPVAFKKNLPLVTYYPGGRNTINWKRVSKIIRQEEYKFNTVYRRINNSSKLAKAKIKLQNWYSTITILKLWDLFRILTIKHIFSLKLEVIFIKYGCYNINTAHIYSFKSILADKIRSFMATVISISHATPQLRTQNSNYLERGNYIKKVKFKYNSFPITLQKIKKLSKRKAAEKANVRLQNFLYSLDNLDGLDDSKKKINFFPFILVKA